MGIVIRSKFNLNAEYQIPASLNNLYINMGLIRKGPYFFRDLSPEKVETKT